MEKAYCTRSLDDLVESLGNAKGKAVVLMGAGCSVSAGIPLGNGVVQEIKKQFPLTYARAEKALEKGLKREEEKKPVDYNTAMANLSREDQRKLLNGFIHKAKVNWAHLALAQLLKKEHIKRVLTVNFDPLLIQACGLADHYPAVYDLTTISQYDDERVADDSILYLNGQNTGFVMLNEAKELDKHKTRFRQVVKGIGTKVIWIVVGYSGEADPLLQVLAKQPRFEADLYWLGFDKEPSIALQQSGLLNEDRRAFYVGSQDADQALTTLAQKLNCFPPDILSQPFQFIESLVKRIKPESGGPLAKALHLLLLTRMENATNAEDQKFFERISQLLCGQCQSLLNWFKNQENPTTEAKVLGAWAYVNLGMDLVTEAKTLIQQSKLRAAQKRLQRAGEFFAETLSIKPDKHKSVDNWDLVVVTMYVAAYSWGEALFAEAHALFRHGKNLEALTKVKEAGERFQKAFDLADDTDKHSAALRWGIALNYEALALNNAGNLKAARVKWKNAYELFERAFTIKSDLHNAAVNWGIALSHEAWALYKSGNLKLARAKWARVGEKFAQALAIKPEYHLAAYNWANALEHEAKALEQHGDIQAAQAKRAQAQELLAKHAPKANSA